MPEDYVAPIVKPLDPRLGRYAELDIKSVAFPVRALLGPATVLRTRTWACPEYLDQGSVGACVGFSMAHDIIAEPMPLPADHTRAMYIYKEAQKIDPWPGEDYEGTSVLAGIKVLQQLKLVSEYRWAFNMADVLETLSSLGPIIFGLNWYESMFDPDVNGIMSVSGRLAGGHAIIAVGYDHELALVRFHNSWGRNWGLLGDAYLRVADLTRLMAERGDACVPVVRTNPQPVSAYYASLYGKVFHRITAHSHLKRAWFYTSRAAATEAGKRPCLLCNP